MEKSESIANLAKALCALQAELSPAALNATNPFLKNRYADLGSIIAAIKPHLKATGLSYSQTVSGGLDGKIIVTTILMHESGEWIESTAALPVGDERGKSLAQAAGGIITYLRRYSLAAILGVYAGDDDDGNETTKKSASHTSGNGHEPPAPDEMPEPPDYLTEAAREMGGTASTDGDLEAALNRTTAKGKPYRECSDDQLAFIIEKGSPDSKRAAQLVLDSRKN